MKSSRPHTTSGDIAGIEPLTSLIKKEKEALVSMFLANASITELAAQYRLIDELNARINDERR